MMLASIAEREQSRMLLRAKIIKNVRKPAASQKNGRFRRFKHIFSLEMILAVLLGCDTCILLEQTIEIGLVVIP